MLSNTSLPNLKTDKNKNKKNIAIDSYHFSKNNSSNRNLSGANITSNKIFFNDEM